jgi:hypothetical protein
VYDLEIVRAVPQPDEERFEDVEYCAGWGDKQGMGVAVIGAVDLYTGDTHVFLDDNFPAFAGLVASRRHLVSFNGIAFDDLVLRDALGIEVRTTYDIKVEAQGVIGGKRIPGRSLADFARVNLYVDKPIQNHAMLPVMWQRGQRGAVINECLSDVRITARLAMRIPRLIDPVTGREIVMRSLDESTQFEVVQPARLAGGDQHGE